MSVGSYGTIRPSDVSPSDVEIIYHFRSKSDPDNVKLKKLNSVDILKPLFHNSETTENSESIDTEVIGGMYDLKLKSTDFNEIGYYSLYLRPKQIRTTITDCGVLSSFPSVRGLVIDLSNVEENERGKFTNQGLVGYRIEYINQTNNEKINNVFRIVTSSFYCTPVVSNVNNSDQKSIKYQYSNSPTNFLFLTVTPSSAPTNKPNAIPFIGQPGQKIVLNNTYFNPKKIDVEIVEHDDSTLAHALYGNQTKAMSSGIYTIYDDNNDIFKQYNLYEIKDEFNETLYEVREERTDIDETLDFNTIID